MCAPPQSPWNEAKNKCCAILFGKSSFRFKQIYTFMYIYTSLTFTNINTHVCPASAQTQILPSSWKYRSKKKARSITAQQWQISKNQTRKAKIFERTNPALYCLMIFVRYVVIFMFTVDDVIVVAPYIKYFQTFFLIPFRLSKSLCCCFFVGAVFLFILNQIPISVQHMP